MEGCQPPIKGEGEGEGEGEWEGEWEGGGGGPTAFATCCISHENKIHSIIIAAFTIS